jgi:subtilase family serine protease
MPLTHSFALRRRAPNKEGILISMIYKIIRLLPIFALALGLFRPDFAHAQGSMRVQPLLEVLIKGQKNSVGMTPAQIKKAYGFDQIVNQGQGQTIAIVDAFDHPAIEQDLLVFTRQFKLPDCTTDNGCFKKVFATGTNPGTNDPNYAFWALEIAIDVEWAHAIAPQAKILLVETANSTLDGQLVGVDVAVNANANVVSMSWGGDEFATEAIEKDGHFVAPNVTFFAAAGDAGHGTIYPAASPFVMSVGATTLNVDKQGNYLSEKAYVFSGGGQSPYEPEPSYQLAYPIPNNPKLQRGTPDVAYDGDPNTGVAVYDSIPYQGSVGWLQVGGTSIGPPQWSGLVAIANSLRAPQKPALTGGQGVLYETVLDKNNVTTFNDVSRGANGKCGKLCHAKPGYDYVTGLGSPQADLLIPALKDSK